MRRTSVILASLLAAAGVGLVTAAPSADAHFCAIPAKIEVGKKVTVNIGVAAEEKAVRAVEVLVPRGFELIEPISYSAFKPTVRGRWVHFEGGEIRQYTCHYFALSGRATRKGRLVARVVTTAVDGTRTRFNDLRLNSELAAQVIYAGVTPDDFVEEPASGLSVWAALAIAVATGGAVVGAAYAFNRRR